MKEAAICIGLALMISTVAGAVFGWFIVYAWPFLMSL